MGILYTFYKKYAIGGGLCIKNCFKKGGLKFVFLKFWLFF